MAHTVAAAVSQAAGSPYLCAREATALNVDDITGTNVVFVQLLLLLYSLLCSLPSFDGDRVRL